jgi:hypothetical protein
VTTQPALPGFSVAHHRTEAGDCRITPVDVFAAISRRWGPFGLDAFAKVKTTKAPAFLGPGSEICEDAFSVDWDGFGRVFVQPPYSLLAMALRYAATQMRDRDVYSVFFVFFRSDTEAMHECAPDASEIVLIRPRIHCPLEPGTECENNGGPEGCTKPAGHKGEHGEDSKSPQVGHCLIVFDPDHEGATIVRWWN